MTCIDLDVSGLITAPMELVNELVCNYVDEGHDIEAMRQIVAFVISWLAERTLVAQLTQVRYVRIGNCSLTVGEAQDRIENLQILPVF